MEAVIDVEETATEQEMEEAEKRVMKQDLYHEQQMYKDPHYFSEYVTENLMIPVKDKQYIDIGDVLYALNKACDKYDYTIDVLLDYIKGV